MGNACIKCQPCRPTGWEEPRECTRRSQQLGIHTFVVAYRNTTQYSIQAVTWRMFGKMGHPGLHAMSRAGCLNSLLQPVLMSKSKRSGMSEDVSVLWLLASDARGNRTALQKGLRVRNSPTCTLSQNGYGDKCSALTIHRNFVETSAGHGRFVCKSFPLRVAFPDP